MDMVIDSVMCAHEDDRGRFQSIISTAIAEGFVEPLGDDAKGKSARSSSSGGAKALKAKKLAANAAKEAAEAEELLKQIQQKQQKRLGGTGGGGGGDLESMIRARNADRSGAFDSWAANLEAKYAPKKSKGKK
jgi:hypothetical protein